MCHHDPPIMQSIIIFFDRFSHAFFLVAIFNFSFFIFGFVFDKSHGR